MPSCTMHSSQLWQTPARHTPYGTSSPLHEKSGGERHGAPSSSAHWCASADTSHTAELTGPYAFVAYGLVDSRLGLHGSAAIAQRLMSCSPAGAKPEHGWQTPALQKPWSSADAHASSGRCGHASCDACVMSVQMWLVGRIWQL